MWSPCVTGAAYSITVDWDSSGIVTGTGEDVSDEVLGNGSWNFAYGRDQARQLSPGAIGRGAFSLCNTSRMFSPENESSPLFGFLGPARPVVMESTFQNTVYPLFKSRIDDFQVNVARTNLTADFTSFDGLADLQGAQISTQVYEGYRTGQIINVILDEAGWPEDLRDIDVGASFVRYWWAEGKDAFTAIQEMISAEGPPSIAYVAPDGTFLFRDRHHRLLRTESLVPQGSFSAAQITTCDPLPVTGLSYTNPFQYDTGWKNIINEVDVSVDERRVDEGVDPVWETNNSFTIQSGQTITVTVSTTEPMTGAVTPQAGSDYITTGLGTVTVTLSRFSGQSIGINLTASGGSATVTFLRLRARLIPVARMIRVFEQDTASIDVFGRRTFPSEILWATFNDAEAVAQVIIGNYAQRRPSVSLRIVAQDEDHFQQILERTVSDRITIRNDELGMNRDFFVEKVSHTIRRTNPSRPPIHAAVLGCEQERLDPVTNPFTFDKIGAGFDDGQFAGFISDNPTSIFIFDHPTQGQFDTGVFAT